jgi:hypothetical protein
MNDKHRATVIKVAAAVVAAPRWIGAMLEAESVTLPTEWRGMIGRAEGAERAVAAIVGTAGANETRIDATKTRPARTRDEFVTAGGRTDTHRLRLRRKS